jgi:xanthine dehydrogenase iron-sulfur cluster and FAD-binding subunit A
MNMPRDNRHSTPAFEILRFVASVCLSRLSRQTRRDFSGYDIGKRRKVSVVPHIALDMAKELLRAVNIAHGDQPVTPEEIASKIEAILLSIPEE